jgi:hypothetical protein
MSFSGEGYDRNMMEIPSRSRKLMVKVVELCGEAYRSACERRQTILGDYTAGGGSTIALTQARHSVRALVEHQHRSSMYKALFGIARQCAK